MKKTLKRVFPNLDFKLLPGKILLFFIPFAGIVFLLLVTRNAGETHERNVTYSQGLQNLAKYFEDHNDLYVLATGEADYKQCGKATSVRSEQDGIVMEVQLQDGSRFNVKIRFVKGQYWDEEGEAFSHDLKRSYYVQPTREGDSYRLHLSSKAEGGSFDLLVSPQESDCP